MTPRIYRMRLLGGLARKLEKPRYMVMKSEMILMKARKKDMMIAGKAGHHCLGFKPDLRKGRF
jgi:hypothetical protein